MHHPEEMVPTDVIAGATFHLHIDLLPRAQSRGLGRALIGELLGRLAAAGSPGVHLSVDPRNTAAIDFYDRLGFRRLPAGSAVLMGRTLACTG